MSYTVDGENWKEINTGYRYTFFFDEETGIFEYGTAGTDSYRLYVTTDGASTFENVELPAQMQGQVNEIKNILSHRINIADGHMKRYNDFIK